jgi:hypothetical protein
MKQKTAQSQARVAKNGLWPIAQNMKDYAFVGVHRHR